MYEEIINCTDWKVKQLCKNANNTKPLAMPIPQKCRIIIVSQAPSRNASEKQILANINNKTFMQILEILKVNESQFHEYFYWTHYGKCYPGNRKGGDQWPTVYCANKFLSKEIELCKQNSLSLVIGIGEPATKYLYSHFIEPNCKVSVIKYANIRNKIYNKNNIKWMFIQHVAFTASWSKSSIDKIFIENLQHKINRII